MTTSFAQFVASITYNPTTDSGTGILAPMVRAMGHVEYAAAAMANENPTLTIEEVVVELDHAAGHLVTTIDTANAAPISQPAKDNVTAFVGAVNAAHREFNEWPAGERVTNLKNLANRAAAIASYFDAECLGVTADPGRSL